MKRHRHRLARVLELSLLLATAAPLPAVATESQETVEASLDPAATAAREKFALAYALAERQDWRAALEVYSEAFQLYPHATTLYNMGYCRAQLGDLVRAWYDIARALDGSEFEVSRRLNPERMSAAQRQQGTLAHRLAALHLLRVPGATLRVDGRVPVNVGLLEPGTFLSAASAVVAMEPRSASGVETWKIYVNPGQHHVMLTREGASRAIDLTLGEGQAVTLTWPDAEPRAEPAEALPMAPSAAPQPRENAEPQAMVPLEPSRSMDEPRPLRTAGIIALATAGAGAGLALGAGIVAVRTDHRLDDVCAEDNSCPAEESGDVDRYRKAAYLTNFGLALGVVGAITGVSLLWVDSAQQSEVSLALAPSGVRVTTHF